MNLCQLANLICKQSSYKGKGGQNPPSRWAETAAFEVYVKRMEVSQASGGGGASGRLVSGDDVGINFLCADQILPISHDNGILREAAFVSDRAVGNSILTQLRGD